MTIFTSEFNQSNSEAQKRILVAGGAGFLGGHLCETLLDEGHRVVCVDNFLTGRLRNVEHLFSNPRFTLVSHDIVDELPEIGAVDQIYNLACAASPPKYQENPLHTFKTSVYGAMNLLDMAERYGASILQSSTSEVYGDPDISPQPEGYHGNVNTVGPRSCYDEGKRAVETLFYEYHQQRGVSTRIARIFNTYGPRMSPTDGRVVSNFVVQALAGEDVTIYGDGSQTRSFCFYTDMIAGLMALMNAPDTVSEPVNLGNPTEFTVLELAETVVETLESSSKLRFVDLPKDDPKQRKPNIARASDVLGWAPKVSLAEGLAHTIPYFAAETDLIAHVPMAAE
ncbi:UDP-glucuronic acid decarboxylase family protein [Octadecabacter ascidiaceicola]|uniref:UDP-glucuronate decarboxylase n=1 Tax=Octadecabacter ascidiaceicola TaxID=1655543 RepID=A0A238JTL0_9RHOB|nr:UDP-glucuronic acid decarboxylase family protein [Octadecabacter ascidiaceicola]SMX33915.1 UDP-glucose 4-epimerase [Octadecabacter ascidiaceicola]